MRIVSLFVGGLVFACAADPEPQPIAKEILVQPSSMIERSWPERSYALPPDWIGSSQIHVTHHPDMGTLIGGPSGLFRLQADRLVSVHEDEQIPEVEEGAVFGLSLAQDLVWVASESGLSVFDGVLRASPISDQLPPGSVRAIAQVGDELWIALETGLWAFDGTFVSQLAQIPGVYRIAVGAENVVSVTTISGETLLLKTSESGYVQQDLTGQGLIRDVVAVAPDRVFALAGGTLQARVPADGGQWLWRRAAIDVGEGAQPVTRAWALGASMTGDGVWIASAEGVSLWTGDELEHLPLPIGISTVLRVHPIPDGRIWLVSRERLIRLGVDAAQAPTYCDDIEPYYTANCQHCHNASQTAQASNLDGFELWRDRFDSIMSLVRAGAMPKDTQGRVDGEAVYLLQRWQEGGMVECDSP